MYKLKKTIFAAVLLISIAATQSFAQTVKKAKAPGTPAKKAAAVTTKAATAPNVLKNKMDSLSAAIGVSFSNSLSSQGIENINADVLTQTV